MELVKDMFYVILLFVLVWIGFYLFTRHDSIELRVLRYDCNLAEFQARIPDDIRNQCRQLKLDAINNIKE